MSPVGELGSHHVASVLDAMTLDGLSGGYCLKMRSDLSAICKRLIRENAVRVNVALGVALPETAHVDTRERMGLADDQVVAFHAVHGYGTPLTMMALFSRQIAGHRTSDIHAGDWAHVDTVHFASMRVRRPKTDGEKGQQVSIAKARKARAYELVTHAIDESLRPHVRAYWLAQGSPKAGPIFPMLRDGRGGTVRRKDGRVFLRRAGKAGERKGSGTSYAAALRKKVWEAKLYDPMPLGTLVAGVPTTKEFDPAKPDKRLCRFQTDTDETLRLDFQSFRRALVTALADAEVSGVDQLAITGHTQISTQQKHYLKKRTVGVPKRALPGQTGPATPAPDAAAILAAISALSARMDGMAAPPAGEPSAPRRPQIAGIGDAKAGLRVLTGGRKS
jgi:hypothetical protein